MESRSTSGRHLSLGLISVIRWVLIGSLRHRISSPCSPASPFGLAILAGGFRCTADGNRCTRLLTGGSIRQLVCPRRRSESNPGQYSQPGPRWIGKPPEPAHKLLRRWWVKSAERNCSLTRRHSRCLPSRLRLIPTESAFPAMNG